MSGISRLLARLALMLVAAWNGPAQLTPEQRTSDFRHLADLVARRYGPYQWKRDALKVDALNIAPWLEQVRRAKDDLDFYEACAGYIASLDDAHSAYYLPSTFYASLGFTVDVYEGKVLIDSINRDRLPAERYPFQIGDELLSVDGRSAGEWLSVLEKYAMSGNRRSTARYASSLIVVRPQTIMPRAHEIGEEARVVVRRQDSSEESYAIRWRKTGLPVVNLGPVPSPHAARVQAGRGPLEEAPPHRAPLLRLEHFSLPERAMVLGSGARTPIFSLPEGFELRRGGGRGDSFYSGVYTAEGVRIGFIRIPTFSYLSTREFETEIRFFQQNTDGLVVDIMRNPGGSACTAERLLAYLMPEGFEGARQEVRITWSDILDVYYSLERARGLSPPPAGDIQRLEALLAEFQLAYVENRGWTRPMPICASTLERAPAKDAEGNVIAYDKPLIVLVDEMTASAGDLFAAFIQDHRRGPLFGMRTMGAGGSPGLYSFEIGAYSEGTVDLTQTLVVRRAPVSTPEYPAAPYLENIGVRPEIECDYMTRDNLLNKGRPFVEAFTQAIIEHIRSSQ